MYTGYFIKPRGKMNNPFVTSVLFNNQGEIVYSDIYSLICSVQFHLPEKHIIKKLPQNPNEEL